MSLFTPSAALLAIGANAIALIGAKQDVSAATFANYESGDSASFDDALRSVLEKPNKAALDIVLADDVVKLFVADPPVGATRFADLEAICTLRFEELFGLDAAEWRVSADWHARRRFMASAAPRWLLSALASKGHKILRIEPAFVRSYNMLASGGPLQWFVCRYPDSVTGAYFEGDACQLVRVATLEANEALMPWLEREALLANRQLQHITLMSPADEDQSTSSCTVDMRLVTPSRHVQLISALHLPMETIA